MEGREWCQVTSIVAAGVGGNMVQGSVSLDNEGEDGCTTLVKDFHRHIHEWHDRVTRRGMAADGKTTDAKKTYLPQDMRSFGPMESVPCRRGGIRISRPDIIHGSTATARSRRRTIFVWPCGIRPDMETLDLSESEQWSHLSMCHQSMNAPMKSTSGEGFRYGRPQFPFPGTTKIGSTSAIGDAMIGARRWDDPQVLKERNVLLGSNERAAWKYVYETRQKLVQEMFKAYPFVKMAEMEAFQELSFYRNRQNPRPAAEKDTPSTLSASLSDISLEDDRLQDDSIDDEEEIEETEEEADDDEIEEDEDGYYR